MVNVGRYTKIERSFIGDQLPAGKGHPGKVVNGKGEAYPKWPKHLG